MCSTTSTIHACSHISYSTKRCKLHKKGRDYGASNNDVKHSKHSGKVCKNCRGKGSREKRKEKKKVSEW
jgi:hypothetical protein